MSGNPLADESSDHCAKCGHPRSHHLASSCVWRTSFVCGCPGFKPASETEVVRGQFAELIREHQQADEYGFRVEECGCGEAFTGTYAEHVSDVLVREMGFADETRAFAVLVPDDPPRTIYNRYTGFVATPATHVEFVPHTRSRTVWHSDECPDCAGECGVHERRLAEALADEQAGKL